MPREAIILKECSWCEQETEHILRKCKEYKYIYYTVECMECGNLEEYDSDDEIF